MSEARGRRRNKQLEVMVAEVIPETPDTTTLILFTGNDVLEYEPGHFLTIDPKQFKALDFETQCKGINVNIFYVGFSAQVFLQQNHDVGLNDAGSHKKAQEGIKQNGRQYPETFAAEVEPSCTDSLCYRGWGGFGSLVGRVHDVELELMKPQIITKRPGI